MKEINFTSGKRLLLLTTSFLFLSPSSSASSQTSLLGVHPLDEKYYASEVIKCKEGSKSFTLDLVNDDFCDCVDGTDEPGTSACPRGRFYCKNLGSTPQFIFSSRVNDRICDCCDGSDEYDSVIHCSNTCVMGGNVEYTTGNYNPSLKAKESKKVLDDVWETAGLKMVIIGQILLLGGVLVFRKLLRRARFRRKRQLWEIR